MPPYRTWVDINRSALRYNLRVVRRLAANADIIAVLKANAYGHGLEEIATTISSQVSFFAVACLEEALSIRKVEKNTPIMLLSAALPSEYEAIVKHNFIPTISSFLEARRFAKTAKKNYPIHFKIDTGMGRLGTWYHQAEETLKKITTLSLKIQSISTHLPSADSDKKFTSHQLTTFKKIIPSLRKLAPNASIHILNSAGLLHFSKDAHDLVRVGLILYGISPIPSLQKLLRPVMTWKAKVSYINKIQKGNSISYGRTFRATHDLTVAVLPAGYADGYPRQLSHKKAYVLINGKRCPVLGVVTMDQLIVDISNAGNVRIGSEAILLGKQKKEEITATSLAAKAGTISWHLFTGITARVHYIYKN